MLLMRNVVLLNSIAHVVIEGPSAIYTDDVLLTSLQPSVPRLRLYCMDFLHILRPPPHLRGAPAVGLHKRR